MITKREYEEMILEIKTKRYQLEVLIKENNLFIQNNFTDEGKQSEVFLRCEEVTGYKKLDEEYKEILLDLHYRYNSQFAKAL